MDHDRNLSLALCGNKGILQAFPCSTYPHIYLYLIIIFISVFLVFLVYRVYRHSPLYPHAYSYKPDGEN